MPPSRSDAEVEAARRREQKLAANARGAASTLLTSALGDTSAAPVARKFLTGQ